MIGGVIPGILWVRIGVGSGEHSARRRQLAERLVHTPERPITQASDAAAAGVAIVQAAAWPCRGGKGADGACLQLFGRLRSCRRLRLMRQSEPNFSIDCRQHLELIVRQFLECEGDGIDRRRVGRIAIGAELLHLLDRLAVAAV